MREQYLRLMGYMRSMALVKTIDIFDLAKDSSVAKEYLKDASSHCSSQDGELIYAEVLSALMEKVKREHEVKKSQFLKMQRHIKELEFQLKTINIEGVKAGYENKIQEMKDNFTKQYTERDQLLVKVTQQQEVIDNTTLKLKYTEEDLIVEKRDHETQSKKSEALQKTVALQNEQIKSLQDTIEINESAKQKQKMEFKKLKSKVELVKTGLNSILTLVSSHVAENNSLKKKIEKMETKKNLGFHDMTPRPHFRQIFFDTDYKPSSDNLLLKVEQQKYSTSDVVKKLIAEIKERDLSHKNQDIDEGKAPNSLSPSKTFLSERVFYKEKPLKLSDSQNVKQAATNRAAHYDSKASDSKTVIGSKVEQSKKADSVSPKSSKNTHKEGFIFESMREQTIKNQMNKIKNRRNSQGSMRPNTDMQSEDSATSKDNIEAVNMIEDLNHALNEVNEDLNHISKI